MKIRECSKEINIAFKYKSTAINAVLHSSFDFSNEYISIIVPGIFGDRGDSRAMFTRIARNLCQEGFSILRFDFVGGGSNFGNYSENDFESFIDQVNEVTTNLLKNFGFLKKVIYIGFSEGLKFAYHVAARRTDVIAIISCNGLCVEEAYMEKINRPRIKNGELVYDSHFGTWISWQVVEKYRDYYIDNTFLPEQIELYGIYSENDNLSQNSKKYWESNNWPLELMRHADHLYTKNEWVELLSEILVKWHCKKIGCMVYTQREFFVYTGKNKICVRLTENANSENYVLFVHGLFQNKSGPGFLFTQIANHIYKKYNTCMFDFPASGDSDGNGEELTYELMKEVLLFVISYLKRRTPNAKIVGIASGCGNYLLYSNRSEFEQTIMLFPNDSNIWYKLQPDDRKETIIDTSMLYDKYVWAEEECCILGNVKNRSKGICLATEFLQKLSGFNVYQILCEYDGYAFVNLDKYCKGNKVKYVNDKDGLVMSAQLRDELIAEITAIIEKITVGKGVNDD